MVVLLYVHSIEIHIDFVFLLFLPNMPKKSKTGSYKFFWTPKYKIIYVNTESHSPLAYDIFNE